MNAVDRHWDKTGMKEAVRLGWLARDQELLPFGAVVMWHNEVIGRGHGSHLMDHSEVQALREALQYIESSKYLGQPPYSLSDCVLLSTHEPCHMCAGATLHVKVKRVVWGSWRTDRPDLFRRYSVPTIQLLTDTSQPPTLHVGCQRQKCLRLLKGLVAPLSCDSTSPRVGE